ncbi:hypothetical protein O181_130237 [Austropuccinia psidii MF-1]|uniref:Uncharacterized protein n=1 Tax=Austropuccinia psidii MF-1 TaxID=1389203 RepID=A0A9Q3L3E2_9BASI|nr:hypothetical protein [Austropuccinia psidii MF-1]
MIALTPASSDVLLLKPGKGKYAAQIFSSNQLRASNVNLKNSILFIHVVSGCDTTSAFRGKGKGKFIKLLEKCGEVSCIAEKFDETDCTQDELCQAGETANVASNFRCVQTTLLTCILSSSTLERKKTESQGMGVEIFGTQASPCAYAQPACPPKIFYKSSHVHVRKAVVTAALVRELVYHAVTFVYIVPAWDAAIKQKH